jgi:hypothetical protein
MKIALCDRRRPHHQRPLWRALRYAVLTVENGQIVNRELRDKLGHHTLAPRISARYCWATRHRRGQPRPPCEHGSSH